MKKESKKSPRKINVFNIAWMAGIGMVIFAILGTIISNILQGNPTLVSGWSIIQSVIMLVLSITVSYGFYALGKKYNSTLLKVVSLVMIVLTLVSFLANIFILSPLANNAATSVIKIAADMNLNPESMTEEQQQAFGAAVLNDPAFRVILSSILGLLALYVVIFAILSILFGIGLLKIKKQVKYAKVTGILEIIGGATAVILIGFLIMLVAFVYELIILYRESKN